MEFCSSLFYLLDGYTFGDNDLISFDNPITHLLWNLFILRFNDIASPIQVDSLRYVTQSQGYIGPL